MKIEKIYRQGDVFIMAVQEEEKVPVKQVRSAILALGETTGHKHELLPDLQDVMIGIGPMENGDTFLKISNGPATLKHEEHGAMTFSPGNYVVRIQREYDVLSYARKVQD